MSGVWFLVRQRTPVMVPASCGVYSGAEPSGLSGSVAMLRSCVSARPAGAFCAAACVTPESAASAPADSCKDSRREICMAILLHADIVEAGVGRGGEISPFRSPRASKLRETCARLARDLRPPRTRLDGAVTDADALRSIRSAGRRLCL